MGFDTIVSLYSMYITCYTYVMDGLTKIVCLTRQIRLMKDIKYWQKCSMLRNKTMKGRVDKWPPIDIN